MPQQPLAQVPEDVQWHWQEAAACSGRDLSMFFHPTNERGSTRMLRDRSAKRVCAGCSVRMECADYAIRAREPFGVWGGLTEEEREVIYRRLDSRHYPRERGAGIAAAGKDLNRAVSMQALGIA
jgi:WhiB family transcriptional regulator, redox-sensing transcriptional regulator